MYVSVSDSFHFLSCTPHSFYQWILGHPSAPHAIPSQLWQESSSFVTVAYNSGKAKIGSCFMIFRNGLLKDAKPFKSPTPHSSHLQYLFQPLHQPQSPIYPCLPQPVVAKIIPHTPPWSPVDDDLL